jgi:GNAT superfamily N-acetyltransferase
MATEDATATQVEIRSAQPDEAESLLTMYEWLFEPPSRPTTDWNPQRATAALSDAIASDDAAVLLAEADGEGLVGICVAYRDINSVRFGNRAWVEDLAVAPSHRSRGIGTRLLAAARGWARERGATHLELDTGRARTDAQRFYERQRPDHQGHSYTWEL